jgi:hypothetical protein
MLLLDAFSTCFREDPDYSYEDALAEAHALLVRQRAIQKFLAQELSLSDLLAVLEYLGIDPDIYINEVDKNLDRIGFHP